MCGINKINIFRIGIILVLLACVSACGQKGPLYLPDKDKVSSSELQNTA
ncbi:MAG: lipoprotein [Proteobacteria bacterium]|nr:lipoprotein [Pseudomonadota bacterium]